LSLVVFAGRGLGGNIVEIMNGKKHAIEWFIIQSR